MSFDLYDKTGGLTPDEIGDSIRNGLTPKSLAELSAYIGMSEGDTAYLSLGGRSGPFIWTLGDFSAEVAADPLQGVYVESDTVAATVGVWKRKLDGFVTPEMFGAVGDWDGLTGTPDDAGLLAALSSGSSVKGRKGARYLLTLGLTLENMSVDFDLNGSEIIQKGDFKAISIIHDFLDIQSISAIDLATVDLRNGDAGSSTEVHRLTVSDGSAYAAGDVVKVISDDLIPEVDPADEERSGEFAKVSKVSGNFVYMFSVLRGTYPTSPRLMRMQTNLPVRVFGGKISSDTSTQPTWSESLVNCRGVYEPFFSLTSDYARSELLELECCLNPKTLNVSAKGQTTSFANFAYGYTIIEYSCEGGIHIAPHGYDVRHVYTTGVKSTSAGSADVWKYGRTRDFKVVAGYGMNCQNSAFDTHPDAEGGVFDSCTAISPYNGPNGTQRNYQLRGRGGEVVNCSSVGGVGYHVYMEYGHVDGARDNTLTNCSHNYLPVVQDFRWAFSAEGQSGFRIKNLVINSPRTKQIAGKFPHVNAINSEVTVNMPEFDCSLTGSGDSVVAYSENSTIKIRGGKIDLTGSTDTDIRVLHLRTDSDMIDIDGTEILSDIDFYLARFLRADASDGNGKLIANIKTNRALKEFSPSYPIGVTQIGATATLKLNYKNNDDLDTNPNAWTETYAAGGTKSIDLRGRGGDHLQVTIDNASASTRIGDISQGMFVGQKLTLRVKSTAAGGSVELYDSGTYTDIATDEIIALGKSYTLQWDGDFWVSCT